MTLKHWAGLTTQTTFVLTSRDLPRIRDTVEFYSGDRAQFVNGHLRRAFRSIWFVGGGAVSGECRRLGLVDEIRCSILPIVIGDGVFEKVDKDLNLHLLEVKAYKGGTVVLCYEMRGRREESYNVRASNRESFRGKREPRGMTDC